MVDSEPSLPWVIALSMVTISSPSTSPTMTRHGFIRSERRTSSAMVIPPWPSVGQPLLERDHVGVQVGELVEAELERPLDGDEPLGGGISLASARSSVVFPALVEPAIMMFLRAATAAARNAADAPG